MHSRVAEATLGRLMLQALVHFPHACHRLAGLFTPAAAAKAGKLTHVPAKDEDRPLLLAPQRSDLHCLLCGHQIGLLAAQLLIRSPQVHPSGRRAGGGCC